MSEIGIISKQYEQLVETIDDINTSVITLKKASLFSLDPIRYKHHQVFEEERGDAVAGLSVFMTYLINVFNRDERNYRFIPEKVLEKFRGTLALEEDLKGQIRAIDKLIRKEKLPDNDQFDLLDRIVTTLDMERNKLSKKIRSARG